MIRVQVLRIADGARALGARRRVLAASLALFVALLFPTIGCRSTREPAAEPLAALLAQQLTQIVRAQAERQQLVGLSVAVVRAQGLAFVTHFGMEDRERGIKVSDATLYRWASISKPLTAVVAMQLAREGALDLDRDVRDYVPEFPQKPFAISSRQLLCHQGGIVHYENGLVVETTPRAGLAHPYEDAVDALAMFAASPLIADPGTRYAYSTHGYVLLGAVVQRAADMSFADSVERRIAKPLAMDSLAPDKAWIQHDHRAAGYRKNAQGAIVQSLDVDVSWKLAGGGFISNVRDLGAFASGMLACRLIDRENRELMWSPQSTENGTTSGYGLGFRVAAHKDQRLIQHSGSQEKTRTLLLILPEADWAVAVMCNCEWAELGPLGSQLLDALLDTP